MYSFYPEMADIVNYGIDYVNNLIRTVNNFFWKDVLIHYKKLDFKCTPSNAKEFLGVFIHHNVNIMRDKKVIFLQEWVDAGILQVKDLVGPGGFFLSFDDFKIRFPTIVRTNFLLYHGVIQAIQQYQI